MTFLPVSVIDGARTHAESMRRISYSAVGGNSGVALPDALKVSPLATPGGSVLVGPGSASIVSTYPGASGQAYSVHNDSTVQIPVPANTGGSPATRAVVVSIRDPQYPGMPTPSNPEDDTYLDVQVRTSVPTDRPYLVLATITLPGSTSTVTAAMIRDDRRLAAPKEQTVKAVSFPSSNVTMSKTSYQTWAGVAQTIRIPEWATYILAEADVNGVEYTGTDTGNSGVRMAMNASPDLQNGIVGSKGKSRQSVFVVGRWTLTSGAGTDATFAVQAYQTGGAGAFELDYQSQVLLTVTFQQKIG